MLMNWKECWDGSSCGRSLLSSSTNVCEVKYEFNMLAFWRLSSASSLFITRVGRARESEQMGRVLLRTVPS